MGNGKFVRNFQSFQRFWILNCKAFSLMYMQNDLLKTSFCRKVTAYGSWNCCHGSWNRLLGCTLSICCTFFYDSYCFQNFFLSSIGACMYPKYLWIISPFRIWIHIYFYTFVALIHIYTFFYIRISKWSFLHQRNDDHIKTLQKTVCCYQLLITNSISAAHKRIIKSTS